jgi:hypothetical protein
MIISARITFRQRSTWLYICVCVCVCVCVYSLQEYAYIRSKVVPGQKRSELRGLYFLSQPRDRRSSAKLMANFRAEGVA